MMTKPKTFPVGTRFDAATLAKIDAIAKAMSPPGVLITRADVIRVLSFEALEARERLIKKA